MHAPTLTYKDDASIQIIPLPLLSFHAQREQRTLPARQPRPNFLTLKSLSHSTHEQLTLSTPQSLPTPPIFACTAPSSHSLTRSITHSLTPPPQHFPPPHPRNTPKPQDQPCTSGQYATKPTPSPGRPLSPVHSPLPALSSPCSSPQ